MAKLVRDLEFSPGQKEPPQQLVHPQPEPWKRDPGREGPSPTIEAIVPRRARAAGGDRVSIRGRNLRVVQVMFGSAPARLLSARGNEVIVETPPGSAGAVAVAVTNDDGTWAVATDPFVYGE
ncbi:MAG: IPT/TIG domain-containing protein [Anaeromyxobacteraceae bacterium]